MHKGAIVVPCGVCRLGAVLRRDAFDPACLLRLLADRVPLEVDCAGLRLVDVAGPEQPDGAIAKRLLTWTFAESRKSLILGRPI